MKMIFGNWKMHGNFSSIQTLLDSLLADQTIYATRQVALFPPFVYLQFVGDRLKKTLLALGAQNVYPVAQGAFTGEISGTMLKDLHCQYVLVGHSERRQGFKESNIEVAKKFSHVQACGMIPILCVGETLAERESNITEHVLSDQIQAVYQLGETGFLKSIVAYEPVWAIGTGKSATFDHIQKAHQLIRQVVAGKEPHEAAVLPIIYGGSVTPSMTKDLFTLSDVHGALVGGASLEATQFLEIVNCA